MKDCKLKARPKEFVVEKYDFKLHKWVFHSEHVNEEYAIANFESSKKKMRVKKNGVVILCRMKNQK